MQKRQFDIEDIRTFFVNDNGVVRWSKSAGRARPGMRAGSFNEDGYLLVELRGQKMLAHRIAWALHFGHWPKNEIDHINCDRSDNHIENLRDVPSFINKQNMRFPKKQNSLGVLGVCARRDKFRAFISVNGAAKALGTFVSAEDAHAAYLTAKRALHKGNTL